MKEQIIEFETAKLAKEKGLNISNSGYFYDKKGDKIMDTQFILGGKYPAPTQSLLQKWLREEHRINVESNYLPNIQKYRCLYVPMTKAIPNREKYSLRSKYYGIDNHETYEQALEKGLQEALKLLS